MILLLSYPINTHTAAPPFLSILCKAMRIAPPPEASTPSVFNNPPVSICSIVGKFGELCKSFVLH